MLLDWLIRSSPTFLRDSRGPDTFWVLQSHFDYCSGGVQAASGIVAFTSHATGSRISQSVHASGSCCAAPSLSEPYRPRARCCTACVPCASSCKCVDERTLVLMLLLGSYLL